MGTHLELHGHLDYTAPKCPKCKGQMAKYDYQKTSKIPYLETAGYPLLIRLRKRRFKCKECGKMAVAETPLVNEYCEQIEPPVRMIEPASAINRATQCERESH